jgi:hypothetical protein
VEDEIYTDQNLTADATDAIDTTESPPPAPQQEVSHAQSPVQSNYNQQRDGDDVPAWVYDVQDLGSYSKRVVEEAVNRWDQRWTERKLNERVESAVAHARERHDGHDGLPEYSELVGYAMPLIQQQPALRQLVLSQPDPAEAAYVIGFCARYPELAQKAAAMVARNGKIDASIFQSIRSRPTVGSREIKPRWQDMDNESFIAALERFKAYGT